MRSRLVDRRRPHTRRTVASPSKWLLFRASSRSSPSARPTVEMTVSVVRRCSTTSRDKSDATARARAHKLVKCLAGAFASRERDDVLARGGEWGGAGPTRRLRSPRPRLQPTKTMTAPRDASRDRVKLVSCDGLSHVSTLRRANARFVSSFSSPSSSGVNSVDAVFGAPTSGNTSANTPRQSSRRV